MGKQLKKYQKYIGKKIKGFQFEPTSVISFNSTMHTLIGEIGEIVDVKIHERSKPEIVFLVDFKDAGMDLDEFYSKWSYPCYLAIEHIINDVQEVKIDYNKNLGKKMVGFKFDHHYNSGYYKGFEYNDEMDDYIGVIGNISEFSAGRKNFYKIIFPDGEVWHYPFELAVSHIVKDDVEIVNTIEHDYDKFIGMQIQGFDYSSSDFGLPYTQSMDARIGEVGKILNIQGSCKPFFLVEFKDKEKWYYPCALGVDYIFSDTKDTAPDYKQYVGRHVKGYKYTSKTHCLYNNDMDDYIGSIGVIMSVSTNNADTEIFSVRFNDGAGYNYPCEKSIPHMLKDDANETTPKAGLTQEQIKNAIANINAASELLAKAISQLNQIFNK